MKVSASCFKLSITCSIALPILVSLSACKGSGQPALPGPSASALASATATPSPEPLSIEPQELRFAQGSPAVRLHFNDQGKGFMLTSGGPNLEALSLYPIEAFKVLEQKQSFPELRGHALADHTLFLNPQGQGQIIAVNMPTNIPLGPSPGIPVPSQATTLELRTVNIQNFKAETAAETHVFKETYIYISLNQLLVDDKGNGFLSLQVRSTEQAPLKMILIPIKNHRLQPVIDATLDLPVYRSSHQFRKVWINADKNGLLLDQNDTGKWKASIIRQGRLSPETRELGTGSSLRGQPIVSLDAQGQGSLYTIQTNGNRDLARLENFKPGPLETLPLPRLEQMSASMVSFQGTNGTLLDWSVANPLSKTRTYTFHHVAQGRLVSSRTLTQDVDPSRIWDSPVALRLTSEGQGLFAWSTLQQGGSNGSLHLQPMHHFLITGPERWLSPNAGKAPLNPIPTPSPNLGQLQRPAS